MSEFRDLFEEHRDFCNVWRQIGGVGTFRARRIVYHVSRSRSVVVFENLGLAFGSTVSCHVLDINPGYKGV